MSTWWRCCRNCGEPGDDVRICHACGTFTPYSSQAGPYDDWRLIAGLLVLATLTAVLILGLGALALSVGGP